jgi:hypothetical protein
VRAGIVPLDPADPGGKTGRVTTLLRPARSPLTRPTAPMALSVVFGIGLAAAMAAFGNRYGDGFGWLGVAGVAVLLAVPVVLVVGYLVLRNRMRIEVSDRTLVHRDLRGRVTTIDTAAVRSVHDVVLTNLSERRSATVLAGEGAAALLVLWHKTWDPWELNRLWSSLGWQVQERETLPASAAPTRFPGVRLPITFVRPFRTAVVAVVCVFGYLGAWIAVMVAITG